MNSALAVLPLPELKNPLRDALILRERINGATIRETAQAAECSTATVDRTAAAHRDYVEAERQRLARTFLTQSEDGVRALCATMRDSANRNQVSAFKELSEKLCDWGGKGGVNVHVGDTYVNALILPPPEGTDPEVDRRMAEARKLLGLA